MMIASVATTNEERVYERSTKEIDNHGLIQSGNHEE